MQASKPSNEQVVQRLSKEIKKTVISRANRVLGEDWSHRPLLFSLTYDFQVARRRRYVPATLMSCFSALLIHGSVCTLRGYPQCSHLLSPFVLSNRSKVVITELS